MKHKHHIIPRHMGGSDDPSNLIELSIEEHADAHRVLYETHRKHEDYVAWKNLSGQMKKEDLQKELSYLGGLKTPKKKVAKYNDNGELIETYDSINDAAIKNNTWSERISEICKINHKRNRNIRCGNGFRYRIYEDSPLPSIEKYVHKNSKKIAMYSKDNELLKIYESSKIAGLENNISLNSISCCVRGITKHAGGFYWRYI